MFEDVESKLRKGNKILFTKNSTCLQDLIHLMEQQDHKTLILWALDCSLLTLKHFESRYTDSRPRICLEQCDAWSKGLIKMPVAKKAILDSHAVAKEIQDPEYEALCHAIGHAGATVHVKTHALGLPLYELTSLVHRYQTTDYAEPVLDKIQYYTERLLFWSSQSKQMNREWAPFLKK